MWFRSRGKPLSDFFGSEQSFPSGWQLGTCLLCLDMKGEEPETPLPEKVIIGSEMSLYYLCNDYISGGCRFGFHQNVYIGCRIDDRVGTIVTNTDDD